MVILNMSDGPPLGAGGRLTTTSGGREQSPMVSRARFGWGSRCSRLLSTHKCDCLFPPMRSCAQELALIVVDMFRRWCSSLDISPKKMIWSGSGCLSWQERCHGERGHPAIFRICLSQHRIAEVSSRDILVQWRMMARWVCMVRKSCVA